ATKGDRLDWTLGEGVAELREATGADYALFSYIRDSYTSEGRAALRVLGVLAGLATGQLVDIGGGRQVAVATLVDLRTGQVVWFNLMARQTGDLRTPQGTADTVDELLEDLPLGAGGRECSPCCWRPARQWPWPPARNRPRPAYARRRAATRTSCGTPWTRPNASCASTRC